MQTIILASQSPRRRELLSRLVPKFTIMTDDSEEVFLPDELPEDTVRRLAKQKAEHVAARADGDALILAADTVVALEDTILGKPADEADAFRMLSQLSGREHQVFTGLALLERKSGRCVTDFVATKVRFRSLQAGEIRSYIASGEPMDKAGAYGIQELGALLVEGIEGDYFNVVGLPLCRLGKLMKEAFGIDLLQR